MEKDSNIQALVIQSSLPTVFSSGLDILEMYQPNADRIVQFWKSFQRLYYTLYGSRLACIAAIEGHAPAAGCMLALSCDYRIMGPSGTIGLNESKLGIVAPPWLGKQLIDTVGCRQAEMAMSLGTLFTPQEALQIGLIDFIVQEKDQVRTKAMEIAQQWATIPPEARVASKMLTRKGRIQELKATEQEDTDYFIHFVTTDTTQTSIGAYLKMLAAKKKK
jgi:3,2-trans-enoyl-CoA isomerase